MFAFELFEAFDRFERVMSRKIPDYLDEFSREGERADARDDGDGGGGGGVGPIAARLSVEGLRVSGYDGRRGARADVSSDARGDDG